jgi:tetratricopeptide (TPR) repeat protein
VKGGLATRTSYEGAAKDPAERYASAAAFAQDIDRYLTNLPILARPPSGLYQLRKLIVRHKTPAALTAALFLLVAAFAIVFGVQKEQVARQRDEAKAQALRAQRISDYVTNMLQSVDPKSVGASVSVKDLLDRAAADLESELANDPETRASMHETLARGYLTLEAYAPCEAHAQKALELRRQLSGEHNAGYASALHLLGVAMCRKEGPEAAEKVLREAYDLRGVILDHGDPAIAESLVALADSFFWRNQFAEAERLFRQAIDLLHAAPDQKLRLAAAMDSYSVMLTAAGRYGEAEPQLTQALAIRRQVYGNDHFDVARTLTDLGEIYSQWGQYDKAESAHREQVRILKKLFPDGHVKLSNAYSDLASILAARDEFSEAEQLFRLSVEMEERVAGLEKSILTKNNYANFLTQQGRSQEAVPLSRLVYKAWHGSTSLPDRGAPYACQNLAMELLELGEFEEAEKLYKNAERGWRSTFGPRHPKITNTLIGLGRLAQLRGDQVDAERLYLEAFDIRRDVLGPTHPETAAAQVYLAGALPSTQPDAVHLCDAALESLRKRWGSAHSEVAWTLGRLAVIQRARGDVAAAERSLHEAIEIERKLQRTKHPNLAACLVELGEILLERGEVQTAEPLFQEALDIQNERFAAKDERISRTKRDLDRCRRSISKS